MHDIMKTELFVYVAKYVWKFNFVQNDHILHTRITSAVFENIIELSIVDVTTALSSRTTSFLEKNITNVFQ